MTKENKYARDPIPKDAIYLSEAFEQVVQALAKDATALATLHMEIKDALAQLRQRDEQRHRKRSASKEAKNAAHRLKEAVVFFRSNLANGRLVAHIRDPATGDVLQLNSVDWSLAGGRLLLLEPPYAFEEDFLDNSPFSGNPNTFLRGAYRPIFFLRREFADWFAKTFGEKKQRSGRPLGSGSYERGDQSYLEQMRALLKDGDANSIYHAAVKVAPTVPRRNAQEQSIITRLAKRYRKHYGSEQK
jgi:hypothetical protein